MKTPVADFVRRYAEQNTARLHMPGHKGKPLFPPGFERFDITEVEGTDGLIEESEANAAALFGSAATKYAAGGASQCVRAMVYLALLARPAGTPPLLLAARNAHKSFLYAAALCGAEVVWLFGADRASLCACAVTPEALERALQSLPAPAAGVYVTSPDYLGNLADVAGLSAVCEKFNAPLLVDNAHGAYLKFLPRSLHPLDLGAAACCDSAHKTLPALTGGAYLHIAKTAPAVFGENARAALDLFGSTSPSWLTLASLDLCNRALSEGFPLRLAETVSRLESLRAELRAKGWQVEDSDPLRLTLRGEGRDIAERLRAGGVEPEYADRDFCVLMASPDNPPADFSRIAAALGQNELPVPPLPSLPLGKCERVRSIREALFAPQERVPTSEAVGRICGAPAVSCPPAVPAAVAGERVSAEAAALLEYYGIGEIEVLK